MSVARRRSGDTIASDLPSGSSLKHGFSGVADKDGNNSVVKWV